MTGCTMSIQPVTAQEGLDKGSKIFISAAAACSGGQSPYFAQGLALPYHDGETQETPQVLATRGFKRA
eukprot:679454-Karenia_brevis.AAC.1